LVAIAAVIVFGAVLVGLLVGHYLLGIATDDLLGIAAGITGNPAILVYANKVQPSDRVDAAYAVIFPSLTILKILCAQLALSVLK
jgi:putative transport protein